MPSSSSAVRREYPTTSATTTAVSFRSDDVWAMWHSVQALNLELASLRTGSSEPKPRGRYRSSHQTEVLDNVDDDLDRIRIVDSGTEASSILLPRTSPAP